MVRQSRLKVFFDGGCQPNPGAMEVAVVVRGQSYFFDDLGHGTHNDAEWLALIKALEVAQGLGTEAFDLIGDAAMVIAQANGTGSCPAALCHHREQFLALTASNAPTRIRWIGRAQNLAGIALEKRRAGRRQSSSAL
ncbi:reverse transcriptase-like protein [Novosphingobium umbonatum]|uniref:Reverse transcriptase-like protein n=1 Tax=Novosphingobium umbonatum TaxID=1908524 RepID=A0A3S3TQH7_9SPHN|nr:reverse transcriptase-like protein [Novosphingobium umbonatum]RVU06270.1 reverse transcriptase-like protein [Novosphingobium umbonatum]